jgi:Tfp pilus assembly protein PilO
MRLQLSSTIRFIQRHIFTVGIIVAALILLLGYLFVVAPRLRTVQQLGGLNYNQKVKELETQQAYLAELKKLGLSLQDISYNDIARLDKVIPKGRDIPGIFRQMQAFAAEAGMELLSVSVTDGAPLPPGPDGKGSTFLHTLTVSVMLGGSLDYQGLKEFLNTVSRQAPILDLTAITNAAESSTKPGTYSFAFRSYYLTQ